MLGKAEFAYMQAAYCDTILVEGQIFLQYYEGPAVLITKLKIKEYLFQNAEILVNIANSLK